MWTLLFISLSVVSLTSCGSRHICDAYSQENVISDTAYATVPTQLTICSQIDTNNEQPKPEVPTSMQNDFAVLRDEDLSDGSIREA